MANKSGSWDEDEIPEEADEDATKKNSRGNAGGGRGGVEMGLSEDSEDGDSAGDSAVDSAVLEEDFDPLYEPSPAEIEEYAEFLGMDTTEDEALMWIAREGLKAPLPEPWRTCKTEDGSGKVYYFNFDSGESIWEHPCDLQYKKLFADEKAKLAEQVRVDAKAEKKEKKKRSGKEKKKKKLTDKEKEEKAERKERRRKAKEGEDLEASVDMDQSVSQDQDASMDASAGEPAAAMARTSSARSSISRERVNSDDEKSSRASFSIKITPTEEKGAAEIEDQEGGTTAAFVETAAEADAATSAAESSMSTRATSSSPTKKVDSGVAEKRVLELEALLVEAREAVDKESARADKAQNDAWRELSKDVTAAKELAAAAELKVAGAEKNAATAEKRVKVLEAEAKVATATTIELRMTATTAKEDLKKSQFEQQTATEKGGQATGEIEGLRRRLEESEKKGEKGEANLAEERRKRDAAEMKLEDATKEWAADRERLEERVTAAQAATSAAATSAATTSAAATPAAAPSDMAGSQADGRAAGSVDEVEWDAKVQAVKDMLTQVKGYLHNQGDLVRKMQKSLQ